MTTSFGRSAPLILVLAFILGMYGFSQASRKADPKFSRDLKTTYPRQAYQAMFYQKSDKGEGRVILSSDGKGHVRLKEVASVMRFSQPFKNSVGSERTENLFLSVDRITLLDYLQGKKYIVFQHDKTIQESPLTNLGVGIFDEEMYKSSDAKRLEDTVIDGTPVRGWLTTFPLTDAEQVEAWFSKQTGCLVFARGAGVTTNLLKYQKGSLPAQDFLPPEGYKKTKI